MPIKIEHLSYVYNPKTAFASRALEDINLAVEKGDFLGIIGHTGSGKIDARHAPERADENTDGRDFRGRD